MKNKMTFPRLIVSIFFLLSLVGAYVTQNEGEGVIAVAVLFVLFGALAMQYVWRDR
jgi:hypothetical protein